MTVYYKTFVILGALGAAYIAGRYTAPEVVKIQKEIVEVEKKTEESSTDTERSRNRKTKTTETKYPDGTIEKTTETEETTDTTRKTDTRKEGESARTETESRTEERRGSGTSIAAIGGIRFAGGPTGVSYGAHIQKEVLGPISVGAFGFLDGMVGLSLGVRF